MNKTSKTIVQWFLIALVITLPLLMGDHKQIARTIIVVSGFLMWSLLLISIRTSHRARWYHWLYLLLVFTTLAAYVIPVPDALNINPEGRALYDQVNRFTENLQTTLSLIPQDSLLVLIYVFAISAFFVAMLYLDQQQISLILYVWLGVVAIEAALGVAQYSTGLPQYYPGMLEHSMRASGTYNNPDHYVAMMEMAIPVIIGMLLLRSWKSHAYGAETISAEGALIKKILLGSLLILALVAGVLSGSRAGIALIFSVLFLSFFLFSSQFGRLKSLGFFLVFLFLGIGLMLNIGIISVINRFSADPLEDLRWQIFSVTGTAIRETLPYGTGPGTFPEVFRAFQPIDMQKFINHAHNDYYELILETGLAGFAIVGLFMLLFAFRWIQVLRTDNADTGGKILLVASGLGITVLLLHTFVDFNFHIPANAFYFTLLCGVFFNLSLSQSQESNTEKFSTGSSQYLQPLALS